MKKVTLKRSLIGALPNQKATAATMGLRKIGDSKVFEENPALDGKIRVLTHLVSVETVEKA